MSLDHLPRWTALLFLLYAAACAVVAVRAPYIQTVAARMKPSARQRLMARPGYILLVRLIAIFGMVTSLLMLWIVLRS